MGDDVFGRYLDASELQWVLWYYVAFWIFNAGAYFMCSFGIYRWTGFLSGLEAERGLRQTMWITLIFGLLRLSFGVVGIGLYETGRLVAVETIVALGMSSLALNTVFIFGEGWIFNREARSLTAHTTDTQELMREAIRQFESLRRAVANAK